MWRKKQSTFLWCLLSAFACCTFTASAQISTYEQAVSSKTAHQQTLQKSGAIPLKTLAKLDRASLIAEEEARVGMGYNPIAATTQKAQYDVVKDGRLTLLKDGSRLWQLSIQSEGALAMNVFFEKYILPQGAKVFIYNHDKSHSLGAFTSANNKSFESLTTEFVAGDELTIEYYLPRGIKDSGSLVVGRIGHDYKGSTLNPLSEAIDSEAPLSGGSQACHIDVNCPEAIDWQTEKRSVCRIVYWTYDYTGYTNDGFYSYCSGALVNNTAEDGTPYFLTANHCVSEALEAENSLIYFNYENPTCNGALVNPTSQTICGATLTANHEATDMALLELSAVPPSSYNAHYAGWNRDNVTPNSSVGIHHPAGDLKKWSKDFDMPSSQGGGQFWRWHDGAQILFNTYVDQIWLAYMDQGATEGGSSGSPLFDHQHRIIGQLYGGDLLGCNGVFDAWYGKFAYSWSGGGTDASSLEPWLDPLQTGQTTLDGMDFGGEVVSCEPYVYYYAPGTPTTPPQPATLPASTNAEYSIVAQDREVLDGEVITFKAGSSIYLYPDFFVESGGDFLASIEACTPSAGKTEKPTNNIVKEDLAVSKMELSPNPSNGRFKVQYQIDQVGANGYSPVSIAIYDLNGKIEKQIKQSEAHQEGTYFIDVNVEDLYSGVYLLKTQIGEEQHIQKIVKMQ